MTAQRQPDDILLLIEMRDHFGGHRIAEQRIYDHMKTVRPGIDEELSKILKSMCGQLFMEQYMVPNEYAITPAGEAYIENRHQQKASSKLIKAGFKVNVIILVITATALVVAVISLLRQFNVI